MAVMSAIESSVIHLIAQGVENRLWNLPSDVNFNETILADYLNAPVPLL